MPALICPICRLPLTRSERTWRCAGSHSFDIAREGYVNLLPVQQKNSRAPGDNPDMVRARHDFLSACHYAPLRDAVVQMLRTLAPAAILDIGCGEGWYSSAFSGANATPADQAAIDVVGIDIAKPAVQRAAKQYPGMHWLVASSASLPLADASVDVVTSLFSPLPAAEMARVLRPGGHLLIATPAADHLQSLRAALFDDVQAHRPEKFIAELAPFFLPVAQQEIRFELTLDDTALQQLLLMTPYAWRAKQEKRDALAARSALATNAAFTIFLLRRETLPSVKTP